MSKNDINKAVKEQPKSFKNDRKDYKLMWELLPFEDIEDIVKVFTFGATKYEPNTWQELHGAVERYQAAMLRHLCEFKKGNLFDPETTLPHLAHMAWNAIAILHCWKSNYFKNLSDRDKKIVLDKANAEFINRLKNYEMDRC